MPLTADDLISLIDEEVSRWMRAGDATAVARHGALLHLRDVLKRTGFPTHRNQRLELSLVPLVFQEANYDDINWTDRIAPLGHLSGIFSIDVAVQSDGRERHELTRISQTWEGSGAGLPPWLEHPEAARRPSAGGVLKRPPLGGWSGSALFLCC